MQLLRSPVFDWLNSGVLESLSGGGYTFAPSDILHNASKRHANEEQHY